MTLGQKQRLFAKLLPRLIDHAHSLGFEVAIGEVERSAVAAEWMASTGRGIRNSLHTKRLAVDLHLFRDDDGDGDLDYLTDTAAHEQLGAWWKAQSGPEWTCCWGGDFGDGNHYSVGHDGVR